MKTIFSIAIWAVLLLPVSLLAQGDLAVVVNKSNPIDNVTKAQLKHMILGEQGKWAGDKKVIVVLRTPGQPERDGALKSVCAMSEDDFNQHVMHASFGGDAGEAPHAVGSAAAVRQAVAGAPGGLPRFGYSKSRA